MVSCAATCTVWRSIAMLPSTATLPLAGESSPVSRRSSVDLPTPLRPTRPVRSHWKWRSRLERTARPSGVDQTRSAMAIDGEEAGLHMDFPGGQEGRRCGQLIVDEGETPEVGRWSDRE